MTAKEVLENLISTIEKNSTDNKATITNVDLWVKSWREELSKVNNSVLDDVIKCEHNNISKRVFEKGCYNYCEDCKQIIVSFL